MFDIFYGACVLLYGGSSFYLAFIGKPAELAGFVVAGAISLVFLKLDSFKEFGGAGFSAKLADKVSRLEKEIDPIRNKQTEPESSRKPATGVTRSSDEKAYEDVLFALTNGRYSWRTITGLLKDTRLSEAALRDALIKLSIDGLAITSPTAGRELWGATQLGYAVEQLHFPGSNEEDA